MKNEEPAKVTPDGDMSESDADKFKDLRDAKPWQDMLDDAKKTFQPWYDACKNVDKQYADLSRLRGHSDREYQIFWANLEVLKPAIYARPPKPVVVPRFKDRKPLFRGASELLERALVANADVQGDHEEYKLSRNSLARTSRGVLWCRYDIRDKRYEAAVIEHLHGEDFLHEPARTWREVGWVARRSWLTKDEGVERFGEAFKGAVFTSKENDTPDEYTFDKKAEVWELWSKTRGVVVWVTPELDEVLDIDEPHLDLEGFFPCPRPAYGTLQPDSLIPVPDFLFYKDQIEEINTLTARIHALSMKLKAKGFYPSGGEDIATAIEKAWDDVDEGATLVGVANMSGMTQGMDKMIAWLPIRDMAETLSSCLDLRRQLIEDIYQITGISDIMRGSTEASETATAQQLKSQYGSVRVRERQEEMKRLCRDATALQGEIIAEHFQPQTLLTMTQSDLPTEQQKRSQLQPLQKQLQQMPPEQQQTLHDQIAEIGEQVTIEQVMQLLRGQKIRPYVLDIETDSTIQPDEDAEKQRRTEFVTGVGGFLQNAGPLVQAEPALAPVVGEMLQYVSSGFRAGRQMEQAIDDLVENLQQRAKQAQQPQPPSPEVLAEQAKAENEKQRVAIEKQKADAITAKTEAEIAKMVEGDPQPEPQGPDIEGMARDRDKIMLERDKHAADLAWKKEEKIIDLQAKMAELQANQAAQVQEGEERKANDAATKQAIDTIQGLIKQLQASLTAPKRVIYDEAGDPVGMETVLN